MSLEASVQQIIHLIFICIPIMIILHLLECVEISALDGLTACWRLYSQHVNAPMRMRE